MDEITNIEDYKPKAISLYKILDENKNADPITKFGWFDYVFPTPRDKMSCKAVFDIKYRGSKPWEFLNTYTNELGELIDSYNQTSSYIINKQKKYEKNISDQGGEHNSQKFKQGTTFDANGRVDEFSSKGSDQINEQKLSSDGADDKATIIKRKGKMVVSTVSESEIQRTRDSMNSDGNDFNEKVEKDNVEARQLEEQKKREEELRRKYEESLKQRQKAGERVNAAVEIERAINQALKKD